MLEKGTLSNIRPNSTFENFDPQNEEMGKIKDGLERLSNDISRRVVSGKNILVPGLDTGKIINLQGNPGLGKTHLLEAIVNFLKNKGVEIRDLESLIYFDRQFGTTSLIDQNHPIVLIDDLFKNTQSAGDLNDYQIKDFSKLVTRVYEEQILLVTSTNLDVMSILNRVEELDRVGRVSSRMKELTNGGVSNFELTGDDYRGILAECNKREEVDPFKV